MLVGEIDNLCVVIVRICVGMDVRLQGEWTYIHKGDGRTGRGDANVHP